MTPRSATLKGRPHLIGMVHLQALPGSPRARMSVDQIARVAAAEAKVLAESGFHAVIVENMHDHPYVHQQHGPEIVSAMTVASLAVRQAVGSLPIGVQVLSGGNREAIAVASAANPSQRTGGSRRVGQSGLLSDGFIRAENFVFAHVADEGLLATAEAGPLLRYRRSIGAEHIAVLCDIKKKHASHAITSDISLADAAQAAEFFGADGLIVTGTATGRPTDPADVAEVHNATRLPVFVGSGVTPDSCAALLEYAHGLIVGSWVKRGGDWSNPVDATRASRLVKAFEKAAR